MNNTGNATAPVQNTPNLPNGAYMVNSNPTPQVAAGENNSGISNNSAPIVNSSTPIAQNMHQQQSSSPQNNQFNDGGSINNTSDLFKNTNWVLVVLGTVGTLAGIMIIVYTRKRMYLYSDKQKETELRMMSMQHQISVLQNQNSASS